MRWYLANGAVISIVFGLVTLAWGDLNRVTSLISAHPVEYAAACVGLYVVPGFASGASLLRKPPLPDGSDEAEQPALRATGLGFLEPKPGKLGDTAYVVESECHRKTEWGRASGRRSLTQRASARPP